jgi:glycerophosphoryl diester phosphodiesterase
MIELEVVGTGRVVVVGHRGAMGCAPENTLVSFEKAAALGADAVECDVQLTRDGQVVVIHDPLVDRVSDGKGAVQEMTLAELRQLNMNVQFPDAYPPQVIPTLAETLETVKRLGIELLIEIKGYPEPSRELVEKTVELVREYEQQEHAAIISFHHPCLLWAREADASIATGILFGHDTPDPLNEARAYSASSIRPHYARVNAELVAGAHQAGLCVHAWTVNDDELARSLMALGVDSLAGNWPDRLRRVVDAAGRSARPARA